MKNRLQRNVQPPMGRKQLAVTGLLTIMLGLTTAACSESATKTSETNSAPVVDGVADTAVKADRAIDKAAVLPTTDTRVAEVGNDGEPDESLITTVERLNLAPGTPYEEVRSQVMSIGWIPYTPAEGAVPDFNDPTVRDLHARGFEEVETCSGTGQGFCAFFFMHVNQIDFPEVMLQITTTPAMGDRDGDHNFYSWNIHGYEPAAVSSAIKGDSPDYAYLEANATYENQVFSAALYAEVWEQEQACVLVGDCANSRYLFEDVLLTFSTGEFGATTMAVTPHASVAREQALAYAQMLDLEQEIDFTDSILVDNYEGGELPPEGVSMTESFFTTVPPAAEDASTKMVRLISRPDEDISLIEFEIVIF